MAANRSELEYARSVHKTLTVDVRRTTGRLTRRFLASALVPLIVFLVLLVISGYVRVWAAASFQSDSLNLTTAISTSLVILVVTWFVLRGMERRFHGWAALQQLFGVLWALSRLETGLEEEKESLAVEADNAWSAYRQYAEVIGHPLPPLDAGL